MSAKTAQPSRLGGLSFWAMALRGWERMAWEEKIITKIWHSTKSRQSHPLVYKHRCWRISTINDEKNGIPQNQKSWLEFGRAMRQLYIIKSGGSRKAAQGINRVGN